jgi:hypothetical protein
VGGLGNRDVHFHLRSRHGLYGILGAHVGVLFSLLLGFGLAGHHCSFVPVHRDRLVVREGLGRVAGPDHGRNAEFARDDGRV